MEWEESKHPRLSDGTFTFKNGTPAERKRLKELGIDLKNTIKKSIIELPKQEYAQFCGEIRTWYSNKIPKNGTIFIDDNYYIFTYNKSKERILCNEKIKIVGNEKYINFLEDIYGSSNRK